MIKTNNISFSVFKNFISKPAYSLFAKKILNKKKSLQQLNYCSFYAKLNKLLLKNKFQFCSQPKQSIQNTQLKKGPLNPNQIPSQNLQIVQTQQKFENQDIQVAHAKGTLSILDKVPGIKHEQSGDLYVLMFRCGQCNHQQIRSFTKNAYHKGVVLVRCGGCQKIHLVADNLGWFEDEPVNVETLHKEKVKKVHDPAAISMFLQKAFGQEEKLLNKETQKTETKENQIK